MANAESIKKAPERLTKRQELQEYYFTQLSLLADRQNWNAAVRYSVRDEGGNVVKGPDKKPVKSEEREESVLDHSGRIRPEAFPFYNPNDQKEVERIESQWTLTKDQVNDSVLAYYRDKYRDPQLDVQQVIHYHRQERGLRDGEIAEQAVTRLLFRFLGDRYLVCRASRYDDVINGIDTVIVDKATGEIVAGFDDVTYDQAPGPVDPAIDRQTADNRQKKEDKLFDSLTTDKPKMLKYGLALKDGELVPAIVNDIPIFYFGLAKGDLDRLAQECNEMNDPISEVELSVFAKLVASLEDQHKLMSKKVKSFSNKSVEKRFNKFEDFIAKIKASAGQ